MTDFRLIYYSENRIPRENLAPEIEAILEASRRNNALVGVTGSLMFSRNHFAQVLEGTQYTIESTFERIQQDARHGSVHLLDFSPVAVRCFDQWSMAFVGSGEDPTSGVARGNGLDPRLHSGQELFDKLREMLAE